MQLIEDTALLATRRRIGNHTEAIFIHVLMSCHGVTNTQLKYCSA